LDIDLSIFKVNTILTNCQLNSKFSIHPVEIMGKNSGPNKKNFEATRKNFLKVARREFVQKGYVGASTTRIVEASGMARGSLYYHFGDKKGVFMEVYKELMHEMLEIIQKNMRAEAHAWEKFIAGGTTYLDLCKDKTRRTIILEAYAVMAYEERMKIHNEGMLKALHESILHLIENKGFFKEYDAYSLSILTFGMLSEGGRSLEIAKDIDASCERLKTDYTIFMEKARG